MKLIDLLVQELPKRGGWPESKCPVYAVQDRDGEVKFAFCNAILTFNLITFGQWGSDSPSSWFDNGRKHTECRNFKSDELCSDYESRKVKAEDYHRALAASQQPVWGGEGLPPVGCECELFDCENWNPVIIKFMGDKYAVTERTDLGYEVVYCLADRPERFRPIRSEADRKREEAADEIASLIGRGTFSQDAESIYDAIAAGKIPGVRLE